MNFRLPASPERPSFWSRFFSLGTYPGMPFDLRREVYLLNGATWVLLVATTLLLVAWLFIRRGAGIWMGLAIEIFGVFLLWIISRRRYQTAGVLLCVVLSCAVVYQSCYFLTGSHVYLLAIVAVAAFLVRNPLWRRSLALALVGSYVAVQASQMGPSHVALPVRYLVNMGLAGFCIYGICSLFREISDEYRRRLDQRNRELLEANAAKEKIFSILSHDLRGPVAALKSGLELLDEGTISPAEFAEMKGDLKTGVDSVFDSMENLLEWSAGQMNALRHHPERIDLRGAFGATLRLLERTATAKRITVENRLPEGAAARADIHQVHAIFRNLVSNALKFSSAGGRVDVSAEAAPGQPGWWRVAVRDDGVGMDAAQAACLFDGKTFGSTRGTADEKGLGLGLQICRDFVRAHGGEIAVESWPGQGTVFRFTLPAWRDEVSIPKGGASC